MAKPLTKQQRLAAVDKFLAIKRTKLLMAALGFVDTTLAEMDALTGTESTSAPAEFMVLHEAAKEYREATRAAARLRNDD